MRYIRALASLKLFAPCSIRYVELDNSSHHKDNRKERDVFMDELFRTIGLPMIRIPVRASYKSYNLNDLAQLIHESVAGTAAR